VTFQQQQKTNKNTWEE